MVYGGRLGAGSDLTLLEESKELFRFASADIPGAAGHTADCGLALIASGDHFLLAWAEVSGSVENLRVARVSSTLEVLDTGGVLVTTQPFPGLAFTKRRFALGWDGSTNWVVWRDGEGGTRRPFASLRGRRFSGAIAPIDADSFLIANDLDEMSNLTLAVGSGDRNLVGYTRYSPSDHSYRVRARFLSSAPFAENVPCSNAGQCQNGCCVAGLCSSSNGTCSAGGSGTGGGAATTGGGSGTGGNADSSATGGGGTAGSGATGDSVGGSIVTGAGGTAGSVATGGVSDIGGTAGSVTGGTDGGGGTAGGVGTGGESAGGSIAGSVAMGGANGGNNTASQAGIGEGGTDTEIAGSSDGAGEAGKSTGGSVLTDAGASGASGGRAGAAGGSTATRDNSNGDSCSCRVAGSPASGERWSGLTGLAIALGWHRRRRARVAAERTK